MAGGTERPGWRAVLREREPSFWLFVIVAGASVIVETSLAPLEAERAARDAICAELRAEVREGALSRSDYLAARCSARRLLEEAEGQP